MLCPIRRYGAFCAGHILRKRGTFSTRSQAYLNAVQHGEL